MGPIGLRGHASASCVFSERVTVDLEVVVNATVIGDISGAVSRKPAIGP
jgi:hypothetical protein